MKLPEEFIDNMKCLLGDQGYADYESSLLGEPRSGIRLNTRKISPSEFEKIAPFKIDKIPYMENGYYIYDTDAASKHPYYFAGLYYIQEPSAMIPAMNADIDESSYVLDLCAAPGGKATAVLSKNPAFLLANDISYSRTIPLVKNIDLFGSGSVAVSCAEPDKLAEYYPGYFDVILVDAPCSGEGMFRKDSSLIKDWENKGPSYYCGIQKNILKNAASMLKSGGELVYSTCTFSKLEDEEVIKSLLDDDETLYLEELKHFDNFDSGFDIDGKYDFSKCIRLFPHRFEGEGHFVAKIRKNPGQDLNNDPGPEHNVDPKFNPCRSAVTFAKNSVINTDKLPGEASEFISHISQNKISDSFIISNDCVYMLKENVCKSLVNTLHYSRTGVMLGQMKGGKHFTPHNSIALNLMADDFDNILDLPAAGTDVIRYLKGETIVPDDGKVSIKKGYTLICTDGYPLGFAKYDGVRLKNLYTAGWRYNGN